VNDSAAAGIATLVSSAAPAKPMDDAARRRYGAHVLVGEIRRMFMRSREPLIFMFRPLLMSVTAQPRARPRDAGGASMSRARAQIAAAIVWHCFNKTVAWQV
jgi:hypothetical protein